MKKKIKVNIGSLSKNGYFLFMTMMQAALRMDELGKNKEEFISLAEDIWNSMEMNDKEHLRELIMSSMIKDLKTNIRKVTKFFKE